MAVRLTFAQFPSHLKTRIWWKRSNCFLKNIIRIKKNVFLMIKRVTKNKYYSTMLMQTESKNTWSTPRTTRIQFVVSKVIDCMTKIKKNYSGLKSCTFFREIMTNNLGTRGVWISQEKHLLTTPINSISVQFTSKYTKRDFSFIRVV